MSPEAIVQDDVARASKLKSQEHAKSENQIIAKEIVKHDKKQNKYVLDKKNEITLKGTCLLATRSDINELFASTSACYALVCKDALISLHNIQHCLPSAVTNILHDDRRIGPDFSVEMDNSIGGWRRRSRPDYNLPGMLRLSDRYTNSNGCSRSCGAQSTQPRGHSSCKQPKNKQEQVEQALNC